MLREFLVAKEKSGNSQGKGPSHCKATRRWTTHVVAGQEPRIQGMEAGSLLFLPIGLLHYLWNMCVLLSQTSRPFSCQFASSLLIEKF